jgi:hypothetical protein
MSSATPVVPVTDELGLHSIIKDGKMTHTHKDMELE